MRLGFIIVLALAAAVQAEDARTARDGIVLASAAADAWADDARLVWIENDAPLAGDGRAASWGYLYYSPEKHAMRSYSVGSERIEVAQDHSVGAEAPAVESEWMDSVEAAQYVWEQGGGEFCGTEGSLDKLLLVRGVFVSGTAWIGIYRNGDGPRLYVVVDAQSGDLLRRWRG